MIAPIAAGGVLGAALGFATLCVALALLAAVARLLRGPSVADRVVALDMVTAILVVFFVLFSLATGVGAYVYVAIALALIGFVATVAFAAYIERSGGEDGE